MLFLVVRAAAEHCRDPSALLFKGCSVDPSISLPLFAVGTIFMEAYIWVKKKKEEEERQRSIEKWREEEEEKKKAEEQELQRQQAEVAAKELAKEQELKRRQEAKADADKQQRLKISRSEIVKQLALVSDYLNHLADHNYSEKQSRIKQNLADELNKIIVKHPLAELQELVAKNPEIQYKLKRLSEKLLEHKIENHDLEIMVQLVPLGSTAK